MSYTDVVELSSDDETEDPKVKYVKQEKNLPGDVLLKKQIKSEKFTLQNGHVNSVNGTQSSSSALNQGNHMAIGGPTYASSLPPAPLTRQFWKAGTYMDERPSESATQNGQNHLRVHPKFLHSNATSHKWAFGAVAELLDNAVDEIQNGATFVLVDKIQTPHDGSPALLIQDDGGGMDPEAMRRCMSFGFSDKKSNLAIGQYGNGFKTSTMRLGADVIVFSRRQEQRSFTQSVGLLSYTFLRQTGHDRIVVPMVDFEYNTSIRKFKNLLRSTEEHFLLNLSMLLQWSPYKIKTELMKQFDDIGQHGTKVIIYNLWFTDDGEMELDFEADVEDIRLPGAPKVAKQGSLQAIGQQHIANQLHYSLREYLSILYLRVPEHFRIILRGQVVKHHNIADDLKHPEFILYKPQIGPNSEGVVVTTIGFLKEAPHVNIHGFSVYHKNRLIMPFWRVLSQNNSRGRGVVGVLEANFIEPTHNKQDFEKTTVFQKLEIRLKEMTLEYWDFHCGLIGYQQLRKKPQTPKLPKASNEKTSNKMSRFPTYDRSRVGSEGGLFQDHAISPSAFSGGRQTNSIANDQFGAEPELSTKRKEHDHVIEPETRKRRASSAENATDSPLHSDKQLANDTQNGLQSEEARILIKENKRLHEQCLELEKSEEELNFKVEGLKNELDKVELEYEQLLAESKLMDMLKEEKV
ncbi:hypothetical protein MKW98_009396 [Papaver atlanticum]|uniref:Morc S5 domain-containing protein n=1 Tax=Papaver atlanticum TaxID=357466 RepID=A0AAD4RZB8_9MAGN|nr:hypothetical protein MKW98_009396 [Papaver atlanticum]